MAHRAVLKVSALVALVLGASVGVAAIASAAGTWDGSAYSANTTVVLSTNPEYAVNTVMGRISFTGVDNAITGSGNDSVLGNNNGNILSGNAGNDTIRGGTGNDTITGGAGVDRLTGAGGNDTFVYASGFGADTITDFSVGDSTNHDTLDLSSFGFSSVDDVLANTDSGANAVIHIGSDTIMLTSVTKDQLSSHQYVFQI